MHAHSAKRPRRPSKEEDETEEARDSTSMFERVPRSTRPEWLADENGRLPLKLSDGRFAVPEPRMRQAQAEDEEDGSVAEGDDDVGDVEDGGDDDGDRSGEYLDAGAADDGPDTAAGVTSSDSITSFSAFCRLSTRQRAARRADRKTAIAQMSQRIIADPDHNLVDAKPMKAADMARKRVPKKQNTLLLLHQTCGDPDPVVRKLAMLSCVMVFKDILPGYRIRLPTAAEARMRVKKDVKKLRDLEGSMLKSYQRFLKLLELTVSRGEAAGRRISHGTEQTLADIMESGVGFDTDAKKNYLELDEDVAPKERVSAKEWAKAKMSERRAGVAQKYAMTEYDADDSTKYNLGVAAIRCMCELMTSLSHFNFHANIAAYVVPRMNSPDPQIAEACCTAVEDLFTADTTCEASLEVVRILAKVIREAPSKPGSYTRIKPRSLSCLLKLRLQQLERAGREFALRDKSKKSKAKKNRAGDPFDESDVLAGLKAADAEALDDRRTNSTAALKTLISIYFRILRAPSASHLLPQVLQGLAKFAHLIDVGVVEDLLASLKALVTASTGRASTEDDTLGKARVKLSTECALNCALTALRIMAGPGELLNADETEFASFLYGTLLRLVSASESENTPLAVQAVSALLLTRVEYSTERVAAFARRCAFVALHVPTPAALCLLALLRQLCQKYPPIACILSSTFDGSHSVAGIAAATIRDEDPFTSSSAYDPDKSNALRSTAWELGLLQNHYNPFVRTFATGTAKNMALLPSDMPSRIYADYAETTGSFRPAVAEPPQHPLAKRTESGNKRSRLAFVKDHHPATWVQAELAREGETEGESAPGISDFACHFLDRMAGRRSTQKAVADTLRRLIDDFSTTRA